MLFQGMVIVARRQCSEFTVVLGAYVDSLCSGI